MPDLSLPLHQFSQERQLDIPFEIGHIEELPAIARTARPHRHAFYEVIWITGGRGSHYVDFENYPIQAETLYFITPGQVHSWEIDTPITGYMILFTEEFLLSGSFEPITPRSFDFFHRVDHRPVLFLTPEHARPFHDLCQHMLDEYQQKLYGRLNVLQSSLHIFLIHAQRHYAGNVVAPKPSTADYLVEDYIRLIDLHFRQKHQVSEYAALLGITAGHLTDSTQARMGMNASQFIDQRIMLEAKRLLAYSEQSVAEIGYALHFEDPSYFTRFFHRESGMTPTAFRRSIREKHQTFRKISL
jgi:AraC-like DNA-binding protein